MNVEKDYASIFYAFQHEKPVVSFADLLADVQAATLKKCADVVELQAKTLERCAVEIVLGAETMAHAFANGKKLLAFGNGDSATDAQDVAVDCMLRGLPALSLTNHTGVVTAIANDIGFENVFLRQISALGKPGDLAIGISTSGNSRDLELAFEMAHRMEMVTMGLAGYEGGKTAELHRLGIVDFCFVAPSLHISRIQEAHATIYHTLIELTQRILERSEVETLSNQDSVATRI
ncbi:MAG: SIS domain-containing protein [Chloroflexi bacterium]|nr:SIS domain-containing protein [Chloroflexota bacterium]